MTTTPDRRLPAAFSCGAIIGSEVAGATAGDAFDDTAGPSRTMLLTLASVGALVLPRLLARERPDSTASNVQTRTDRRGNDDPDAVELFDYRCDNTPPISEFTLR
jgi:hypothetical protein